MAAAGSGGDASRGARSLSAALTDQAREAQRAERSLLALQSSLGGADRAASQTKVALQRLNQAYAAGQVGVGEYLRLQEGISQRFSVAGVNAADLRRNMANLHGGFERLNTVAAVSRNVLASFGVTLGVAGMVSLTKSIVSTADEYQRLSGRIRIAIGDNENFAAVQQRVFEISQTTRQNLSTTTEVFARLSNALRDTGLRSSEVLSITETLGKAIAVSGASTTEASSALLQLSQAMGAGRLQGDELRSILENMPILARAIAEEMGVTIGQLKDLGRDGAITADIITQAISSMAPQIEKDFQRVPVTVGAAMTQVRNSFTQLVGDTERSTAATQNLAEALSTLGATIGSAEFRAGFQNFIAEGVNRFVQSIEEAQAVAAGVQAMAAPFIAFGEDAAAGIRVVTAEVAETIAAFNRLRDESLAAVEGLVTGVQEWLGGGRLDGALAGVQAKVQGVIDAFEGMYNAVVGQSYVPDMVTEVEGWMERLEPAMVGPAQRAAAITADEFARLPAHIRTSLQESIGEIAGWMETLEPAMVEPAQRAVDEANATFMQLASAPMQSALDDLADSFSRTFQLVLDEGVNSFEDLADAAHRIFTSMSADIGRNIGKSFAGLGAFGGPLGSVLGSVVGVGAGFGISKLFGGLFGGGPTGRETSGGAGVLGAAGVGGTGQAAGFVRSLDSQLIALMTARQEQIVNQALQLAPAVRVKYQEQPSAGDLSRLAAGRIGPAASALGFNAAAITGAPGQLPPEQQLANLQEAISLLDQIESFRIGPVVQQFRILELQFDQLRETAAYYGISLEGVAEAQARETAALDRRLRAEASGIMAAVGAVDPLTGALQQLQLEMEEATARAAEFGISTANAGRELQLQTNILVQQDRLRRHAIMQQVGLINEFDRAILDLNANMQIAWQEAERLGISTAKLSREYQLQVNILAQQERIHRTEVMLSVGAISELDAAITNLNAQLQIAWQEAERLGISTANVHRTFALAAQELVQSDRQRRHANLEMIGLWTPLGRAVADLDVQFELARIEAERLGYSTAKLAQQQRLAESELIQQDRLRRHANLELIGQWSPLRRELSDLQVQMELARIEAERLGYSTANVAREQERLAAEIIKSHEAQINAMARSIRDPFKALSEPLREFRRELEFALLNPLNQAQRAQDEFRRIAARAQTGDTQALQQLEQAGQFYIEQMGRFGASPGQVAATKEVASVVTRALDDIEKARAQAERGVENEIKLASQREVDTLRELIAEVRTVAEEIKRLRR